MGRVTIEASAIEFDIGGNTIWIHDKIGGTAMRIKTLGTIKVDKCAASPISHCDIIVEKDINFCLAENAKVRKKPKLLTHYCVTSLTDPMPERIVRCFQEIHKRVSIDNQWGCPPIPKDQFQGLTEQEAKTLISRWNELGEGRYKYELLQA